MVNNANDPHGYWRDNHADRPYYNDFKRDIPDIDYDRDLSSAYDLGTRARSEYGTDRDFESSEGDLKQRWEEFKADSRLQWEQAKHAIKDAWYRN